MLPSKISTRLKPWPCRHMPELANTVATHNSLVRTCVDLSYSCLLLDLSDLIRAAAY